MNSNKDLEIADKARKYWRELENKYDLNNKAVILIDNDDDNVNYLTLAYADEFRISKNYESLIILNANAKLKEEFANNKSFIFLDIDKEKTLAIKKLYMLYKFTDRLIINNYDGTSDTDAFNLLSDNITVNDIVAISILGLNKVPAL
ncbi:MAG: hypothetical protein K5656_08300 [Lachnospiraceae bacterium]|nr:hypothetical protein [Lachnospiraceae bacterium]